MVDENHQRMSENQPRKIRPLVIGLAVIYVMTFLSGFLQNTPFNFVNYILFLLLSAGGFLLMRATVRSRATAVTVGFLFLTGICTLLLLIFGIGYEWSRLGGHRDLEGLFEGILYLVTLVFLIGVIGSLALATRMSGRHSGQS